MRVSSYFVIAIIFCCYNDLRIDAWTTSNAQVSFNLNIQATTTSTRSKLTKTWASSHHVGDSRPVTSQKKNQQELISFMREPMLSTVSDGLVSSSSVRGEVDRDILHMMECIVMAADGRKADNIVCLNVRQVSSLCSYLIILTGNSRPQNQAIASAISKDMKEQHGMTTLGNGVPEGSAESGWILLDYGSIMVHIMTPKSRLYYNIEGQWRDKGGIYIDISHMIIPNSFQDSEVQMNNDSNTYTTELDEKDNDPFWS